MAINTQRSSSTWGAPLNTQHSNKDKTMKRRTIREWQVTETDGRDTLFTPITSAGLKKALQQLKAWTEEYNALPDSEKIDGIEPRIELYVQKQYDEGFGWDVADSYYYCPITEPLDTKKAQNLWDNREPK